MVEPGPRLAGAFLKEHLADEVCIYVAPKILGDSGAAGIDRLSLRRGVALQRVEIVPIDGDVRVRALLDYSA
jgi:diaminohydroxyphosphoribosylaminopyrimidine deaminase/5-amino-6-(5-phosphoribosylamino)uracil reductase